MFYLAKRLFSLGKISLLRASCPQELERLEGNVASQRAIVVARNAGALGKIEATGYVPKAVVISGASLRRRFLDNAMCHAWAFVERGTDISASETMEPVELLTALKAQLRNAIGIQASIGAQAVIYEVYPFENRISYSYKNHNYTQAFGMDAGSRSIGFVGPAREIFATAGVYTGDAKESMLPVQTGVRYSEAPVRANLQSFTTGAKHSELVTQIVRNLDNVHAAVAAYLTFTKANSRVPMRPSFYPVPLSDQGKVESSIAAHGIDLFDFATFIASQPDRFIKKLAAPPSVGRTITTKKRKVAA